MVDEKVLDQEEELVLLDEDKSDKIMDIVFKGIAVVVILVLLVGVWFVNGAGLKFFSKEARSAAWASYTFDIGCETQDPMYFDAFVENNILVNDDIDSAFYNNFIEQANKYSKVVFEYGSYYSAETVNDLLNMDLVKEDEEKILKAKEGFDTARENMFIHYKIKEGRYNSVLKLLLGMYDVAN